MYDRIKKMTNFSINKVLLIGLITTFLAINSFPATITFGITNVTVKDDYYTIKQWANYLKEKTGFDINLKITKSYDEMQYFIENKNVDIAYICGATYVFLKKDRANVNVLVVPFFKGKPLYYSYIIVPINSKARNIMDLQGKTFAFSDPKSNSGSIAPSYYLYKHGYFYKNFFKEIIYTYSHAESIKAVSYGFVDGAAVDSLVFGNMKIIAPSITSKVKVIQKLGPYPTTPIIYNDTLTEEQVKKLKKAFIDMKNDPEGRTILRRLGIDYFGVPKKIDYSPIENMIDTLKRVNAIMNKND